MKKHKVEITETLKKIVEIEANSPEEAIAIVKDKYYKEEYILNDSDYIDTEIESIDDL